jgi:hypothetical protein
VIKIKQKENVQNINVKIMVLVEILKSYADIKQILKRIFDFAFD